MHKFQLFPVVICLFLSLSVKAQISDEQLISQIKNNPNYLWTQREALDCKDAIQNADQELVEQVGGVFIASITDWIRQEAIIGEKKQSLSDFKDQIKRFTGLYLRGLKHLSVQKAGNWSALAYIHRDSLAVSFQFRKAKMRDFYCQALNAEKNGRIGESLRYYYWGFLLAHAFLDTLEMELASRVKSVYPLETFASLLVATLDDIKITANDCYQDGITIIAPLKCTFRDTLITELNFSYYSGGEGMDWGIFEDGITDIPLYDKPSSSTKKLTINIEYIFQNDMNEYDEISGLYEIFKGRPFNNKKILTLNFPWVITKAETTTLEEVQVVTLEKEPPFFREAIDVFRELNNISQLQDFINQYTKLEVITVGRPEDFGSGVDCYIVLLEGPKIIDLVYNNGEKYISLKSKKTYSDLTQSFPGKGQIWFKPVKKI